MPLRGTLGRAWPLFGSRKKLEASLPWRAVQGKMLAVGAAESPASSARFVSHRSIFQKANLINASLHDSIVRLKFRLLRQEEFLLTQPLNAQLELHS